MKINLLVLITVVLATMFLGSCDDSDEGRHCFSIKDRSTCESDDACSLIYVKILIVDNDGYYAGPLSFLSENVDNSIPYCFPRSYTNATTGHTIEETYDIVKFVTPNIVYRTWHIGSPEKSPPAFQEEFGWYAETDPNIIFHDKMRYPPVCGDGIIHPGEQCDTGQLGTMEECAVYSSVTGDGAYTGGYIGCDEFCRWDFSECIQ